MHRPFKVFLKLLISIPQKNSRLLLPGSIILISSQKMQGMDGLSIKEKKLIKTKKFKRIQKKKEKRNRNKLKKVVVRMQNRQQKMHV